MLSVEHVIHVDARQLRSATIGAFVVKHFNDVLRTLVVTSCKGNVQVNVVAGGIDRARYGDAIDNLVWKGQ